MGLGTFCSDLMKPDTHLGENARHREVSDDLATTYLTPEFKREADSLVLDQSCSHIKAARSLGSGSLHCVGGLASSSRSVAVSPRPVRH
jgi:hypothetical protein